MSRARAGRMGRQARRIAGLAAATAALSVTPAAAAAPTTTGWWTSLPIALAPDAPEDSLVVESGPDSSPISFAALSYPVNDSDEDLILTLAPAEGAMSTFAATLTACQLTDDFEHAAGGPMSEAPDYTCDISATATASADTAEYVFDLEGFTTDGDLDVAILATGPAQRIVIAPPGTDSLRTTKANRSATSPPPVVQPNPGPHASTPAAGTAPSDDYATTTRNTPTFSAPPPSIPTPPTGAHDSENPPTADVPLTSPAVLATADDTPPGPNPDLLSIVIPLAVAAGLAIWLHAGRQAIANATESDAHAIGS